MIENKELKAEIVKNLEVYEKISRLVEKLDEEISDAVTDKMRNWCKKMRCLKLVIKMRMFFMIRIGKVKMS